MSRPTRRGGHEFAQIFSDIKADDHGRRPLDKYWQTFLESYHEKITVNYWLSAYKNNRAYAYAMAMLQSRLETAAKNLYKNRTRNKHNLFATITIKPQLPRSLQGFEVPSFLAYNERLHSRWTMLFFAMAASEYWTDLEIFCIGMPKALLELMTNEFAKKCLRTETYDILMAKCNIGREGMCALSTFLRANKRLSSFRLVYDTIDAPGAKRLALAATNCTLNLNYCNLGTRTRVLSAILNSSDNLSELILWRNNIRGRAAAEVANFIASNPILEHLDLNHNDLCDRDAHVFAQALKVNNRLKALWLQNNKFTQAGVDVLAKVVFDATDLNALFDSNKTCRLKLCTSSPSGYAIEPSPVLKYVCFKAKLFHALCGPGRGGSLNLQYISGVPLELMPRVLCMIQDLPRVCGESNETFPHGLDLVFEVARKWQLPLLYFYRSSQNRHPVIQCVDDLVSKISADGLDSLD